MEDALLRFRNSLTWAVGCMHICIQKAFDAATNFGEKSDILRYEILEKHGGVYADVDVACVQAFDSLPKVGYAITLIHAIRIQCIKA